MDFRIQTANAKSSVRGAFVWCSLPVGSLQDLGTAYPEVSKVVLNGDPDGAVQPI